MCFRFDAWCCFGAVPCPDDDYCGSTAKDSVVKTHYPPPQRNGHHHYGHQGVVAGLHGNGHRAPQLHVVAAAADEEDRKAANDVRRGATKAAHGQGYAAGVYSGPDGTLKHPAANTTIADGAGHGAHYYYYDDEREPAQKQYYNYR